MKRSIQDVEHSDSFSEVCEQYNIPIHTANDVFQQKESIEGAIDNTYSIIHKQADTGAKLKIERSVDTIIQLVGLVFSGQICISHNRDLDLNAEKIRSIASKIRCHCLFFSFFVFFSGLYRFIGFLTSVLISDS